MLEGSGVTDNVFPQLKGLNRGKYRTFEKRVRRYIEKNGTVDIEWNFIYDKGSTSPKIQYSVSQNGKNVLSEVFDN
ncbi:MULTISPECIES: DNA/RNA non-specific endonuclease [unclassified Gilliamella]|uniref:DNA/RNA non-specific endonuclease n=1 Tax=unclassified Gilliamella TaxID=2685620 RepID=UPI003A5CC699